MAFRDLVVASTFWGRSACGRDDDAKFETVTLEARKSARVDTKTLLRRILRRLKTDPLSTDVDLLNHLKIKCGGKKYVYSSYVGGGTYGRVYKFTSGSSKMLAIKFIPSADQLPSRIPPVMACNVIKSAVFADGQVIVMELGDVDASDLLNTPEAIEAFCAFCDDAALCLVRNNLVCTDWKLSNITVFKRQCPGFRIIDPDGILICQSRNQWYPVTFSCTWTPSVSMTPTRRERNICAARAFITTAYNIELSKTLFANNMYNSYEIEFLTNLGQRDTRLKYRERATVSRTMVALSQRHKKYATVLELLNRLQAVDKRIFEDDNQETYEETIDIIVKWFAENHRPLTTRGV